MGRDDALPKSVVGHLNSKKGDPVYNVWIVGGLAWPAWNALQIAVFAVAADGCNGADVFVALNLGKFEFAFAVWGNETQTCVLSMLCANDLARCNPEG